MTQSHFEKAIEKAIQKAKDEMVRTQLGTTEQIAAMSRLQGRVAGLSDALALYKAEVTSDNDMDDI